MDGIGIGEDVMGRLPISVLVGAPEACQQERGRIGEGTTKVGSRSARRDGRLERIQDRPRVIAEERLSERHVI